jgi:hypothetical protein
MIGYGTIQGGRKYLIFSLTQGLPSHYDIFKRVEK